ncbi:MAG: spore maturation protein [Deltaproteobacteria bacterium]|nr:spore maturation protein [Deltaproteobacteria bacterium]
MNLVFFGIVLVAFVTALVTGSMAAVSLAALDAARASVDLAISLIGYMALFLGIMRVANDAGLLRLMASSIRPIMVRLFPGVPPDHPAMGAMIMNIAANMIGLTNAATPLGIKAMKELDTLNPHKGTATDAMALFLAINTSGLALLPSGVVTIRAAAGSTDPWSIIAPTLFATSMSTLAGIAAAFAFRRLRVFRAPPPDPAPPPSAPATEPPAPGPPPPSRAATRAFALFLAATMLLLVIPPALAALLPGGHPWVPPIRDLARSTGDAIIPTLIVAILAFGWRARVKVYESFVAGAREGFDTGVMILPYLVAILVAVGMFRASGAMELLTSTLGALTAPLGLPGEALPVAIVRPLSGSGAFGLMTEVIQTHGPDSYVGVLVSVLNGSTETTFYVMAVYFGAVGVTRARHAIAAGLTADLVGVFATTLVVRALFGHLLG